VRGHIFVALGTGKEDLEKLALANERVKPFVDGKQIVRVVVVPDRLVNIVVK
jgi:leucyl-tRNA synthetase